MADIADLADSESELHLKVAIDAARGVEKPARLTCKYCGDPLPYPRRETCVDCQADHEHYMRTIGYDPRDEAD